MHKKRCSFKTSLNLSHAKQLTFERLDSGGEMQKRNCKSETGSFRFFLLRTSLTRGLKAREDMPPNKKLFTGLYPKTEQTSIEPALLQEGKQQKDLHPKVRLRLKPNGGHVADLPPL